MFKNKKYYYEEQARQAENLYKKEVSDFCKVPIEDLIFSCVMCYSGLGDSCVYKHFKGFAWHRGVGNWKCVFCGHDDDSFM